MLRPYMFHSQRDFPVTMSCDTRQYLLSWRKMPITAVRRRAPQGVSSNVVWYHQRGLGNSRKDFLRSCTGKPALPKQLRSCLRSQKNGLQYSQNEVKSDRLKKEFEKLCRERCQIPGQRNEREEMIPVLKTAAPRLRVRNSSFVA